jgi:hypothetical protein
VLGSVTRKNSVPQGRLMIPQDEILGVLAREERLRVHRTTSFPLTLTQDFILGYSQPSLRDYFVADAIWTRLTLSRPFGTQFCK